MAKRGGAGKVKKPAFDKRKFQLRAGGKVVKRKRLSRGGTLGPGTHRSSWFKWW